MGEFHQHPDGHIYVRTEGVTYADSRADFIADFGVTPPDLPPGADDHIYTQGRRHAFMGDGNIIAGGEMPWSAGDQIIAAITSGLALQQARADQAAQAKTAALAALPLTSANVDAERNRRINLGFVFQAVAYQSRLDRDDFENISGMGALAINALRDGTGTASNLRWFDLNNDFKWIAANNSQTPMDAPTMIAFGKAAAMHKSAHIFAAATIKAADPIPADYTADAYWPPAIKGKS